MPNESEWVWRWDDCGYQKWYQTKDDKWSNKGGAQRTTNRQEGGVTEMSDLRSAGHRIPFWCTIVFRCFPIFHEFSDLYFSKNLSRQLIVWWISACAAFFRRTIALKKTFECITRKGQCVIHYSKRFKKFEFWFRFFLSGMHQICRFCRHKKCLEAGMKESGKFYDFLKAYFLRSNSLGKGCKLDVSS